MAFPQTALPIVGELYAGSLGWIDATSDLRLDSADSGGGIEIKRGRTASGERADPGSCNLVLNNRHGKYSPRNPRSALYGLIGRNTPVRIGVEMFRDAFGRTVSGGIGTADSGQVWNSSAVWNVSGGKAVYTFPAANVTADSRLVGSECVDAEQIIDVTPSAVMTGASMVVGFMARFDPVAYNYYWLRCEFDVGGVVRVKISYGAGAATTELGTASTAVTYAAGTTVRVRAAVVGSRLAIKVWRSSDPEPRDWALTVTDTTYTEAGVVGIRNWLVAGNTNAPVPNFTLDNYRVILPRFFGEISSWPSKWDLSGKDVWVPIEASGILRRLNQGAKPPDSALYRYLSRTSPSAYWPLEDPAGSLEARSAVEGVPPMTTFGYSRFTTPGTSTPVPAANLPVFGSGDGIPGSAPVIDLAQGGVLQADLPHVTAAGWRVEWVMRSPRDQGDVVIPIRWATDGTWNRWDMQIEPTGLFATFGTGSSIAGTASATLNLYDGLPHHFQVEAFDSSGNADVRIYVDDLLVSIYTLFGAPMAGTSGSITQVILNPLEIRQDGVEAPAMPIMGHVAVWNAPYSGLTDTTTAMLGHAGETAGARMERLGIEEGVNVRVVGDPDETEPAGSQRADTFLNLLQSCALVDGGILYEDRSDLALIYRARNTLYNQTTTALSYSAGHISEPFEPVEDDDAIRNDVTVTRDGGSSSRVTLDSGPLSVLSPPNGVGIYDEAVSLNLAYDTQALDEAGWRVHLGTPDEARYPRVRIDLASSAWSTNQALAREAAVLDSGEMVSISGLPDWLPPGPIKLMVQGYTERLDAYTWDITWNATPGSVWDVAAVDGTARVGVETSSLASALTSTATSLSISSASNEVWTIDATEMPVDILVGGERMRIDAAGQVLNSNAWMTNGVTGWVGDNATIAPVATPSYQGYPSAAITVAGGASGGMSTATRAAVTVGTTYTASIWAYCSSSVIVGPAIDWHNSSGTYVSTSVMSPTTIPANTWTLISAQAVAPATAAQAEARARHDAATPAATVWYTTGVTLIPSNTISGTSPQPFTVTRSVNGIVKTHSAGAEVHVADPAVVPV